MNKYSEITVVGGGLSGLVTAYQLSKLAIDFQLFEARPRFGGRILSRQSVNSSAYFDLGPSWFWPGQSNILNLINELGLEREIFEQSSDGLSIYEPTGSRIQYGVQGISMAGAYRLKGGLRTLIDALVNRITQLGCGDRLHLSSCATKIGCSRTGVFVNYQNSVTKQFKEFVCDQLVLAVPARVAIQNIEFSPKLHDGRVAELQGIATWMAGHAKVVAEYKFPFWRQLGFSGDVISQVGPMSEIHDASSNEAGTKPDSFALFGFIGMTPQERLKNKESLPRLVVEQLTRLFGEHAKAPLNLYIQDWAKEPFTATERDQKIPNHHPLNVWSTTSEPSWQECLFWSGSETAVGHSNGYLEGAVIASKQTMNELNVRDC